MAEPSQDAEQVDLTTVSFKDTAFLQAFGLHEFNVLARFNNLLPAELDIKLLKGVEYELWYFTQQPSYFVLRKSMRYSPVKAELLTIYYIIEGTIFQAPSLDKIATMRLTNTLHFLNEAFDQTIEATRYHPVQGYSWDSDEPAMLKQKEFLRELNRTGRLKQAPTTFTDQKREFDFSRKIDRAIETAFAPAPSRTSGGSKDTPSNPVAEATPRPNAEGIENKAAESGAETVSALAGAQTKEKKRKKSKEASGGDLERKKRKESAKALFLTYAKVDSIWWPHATLLLSGGDLSTLKSKVPLTMRGNAASFYKSLSDPATYNFDYFLLASIVLLLLSFLGGVVQNKGGKRVVNVLSLIALVGATAVELVYSRPMVKAVVSKSSGNLINNLFYLGVYHGITLALLVLTVFLQVSADQEEDGEEPKPKEKKD
ncbi:Mediator of RNA polymerase II transcription subunit 6 [Kappamyces sp. JEL0829]|nr:Mediator of RNA polymerase II transcription subunit 6 [Kappamyces sp. JEL0829]